MPVGGGLAGGAVESVRGWLVWAGVASRAVVAVVTGLATRGADAGDTPGSGDGDAAVTAAVANAARAVFSRVRGGTSRTKLRGRPRQCLDATFRASGAKGTECGGR